MGVSQTLNQQMKPCLFSSLTTRSRIRRRKKLLSPFLQANSSWVTQPSFYRRYHHQTGFFAYAHAISIDSTNSHVTRIHALTNTCHAILFYLKCRKKVHTHDTHVFKDFKRHKRSSSICLVYFSDMHLVYYWI